MILLAAKGLSLLDVNPGLVVWTLVTFLVVVLVLKKFAWDVILKALDERAETVQNDIKKASELRLEAEALLKDYEARLNSAKDEANAIVAEAKSDALKLKNKLLEETNGEVKAQKDQAVKEIELAKAKALGQLQAQIVEMTITVAAKVLEKQLKSEDYKAFIETELDKLGKLSA
ncbi:ATP synthase F0, B subunit [Leptospira interrogans str. 2003000735]|uniref:ATP synthase subunit b n=6 Tax=Leptospira interrogans TaxID=173 RepID=A0AAP9WAJ2_LEPIR|nr:F0F1 ATP synthase subunit B [Leptospira interrogans]EMG10534.1 ATP synthase F0, B subunit [Leptospira interrogans serovar Grippotyphosa str. LT2186]EMM95284.1 ATP synthase F0, B subunit [Leptospira interrogans serovar Zanoni str. LT2156]EMY05146.1 ATP synthase F0, B subunit [Leptospira interrogans str. 2002000626]EMY23112.1 ATP synthase F0, B subunit [Leptospira interrogans serovar Australis str. 200703203]AJR13969.1 F0F1 ATP synthase subunit B [Leptospira interrogans serovar Linhai str. 56